MLTLIETFSVRLKITESLEVTLKQHDKKRFPRPWPNHLALSKLKSLENEVGSNEWIAAWFEYLSEDKKDRDNIRDLIISKLPNKVLFRVGFVPSYKQIMFNYAKNPFLIPYLKHKKDYYITSFCMKEVEEVQEKPKQIAIEIKSNNKDEKEESTRKSMQKFVKGDKRKSIKKEVHKFVKNDIEKIEPIQEDQIPTDSYLDGIDVEDVLVQIELFEGEKIISLGNFKVRGEGDNYVQMSGKPYVQVGEFTTKKEDLAFGSVNCSYNILSQKELLRMVQGYDYIKQKWVKMPSLNFLPPKVNKMLDGEGGLLLLIGDIQPYIDLNALPTKEEKIDSKQADTNEKESFNYNDSEGVQKKVSISEPPLEEEEYEKTKDEVQDKLKGEGKKKLKKKSKIVIPKYKPPEFPSQHLLVVCNPIARTFRILPPMHVNLENMVARLVVHSSSNSYITYIVGFHRRIKECIEAEGMRVAVYKSTTQKWEIFVVPSCRMFRPSICSYNQALPLVTKLYEGPTLFVGGQVITNIVGIYRPVVFGYRLRTRTWKAYNWPPLSVTEPPQVLEVNNELYIIARGTNEPRTISIWKFTQYVYEYPDCKLITMMPQILYNTCFIPNLKSSWDCVSSMDCIIIVSREFANFIISYNVKMNKWLDPLKRYPGFISGLTFLGNWNYEIAPYALV